MSPFPYIVLHSGSFSLVDVPDGRFGKCRARFYRKEPRFNHKTKETMKSY